MKETVSFRTLQISYKVLYLHCVSTLSYKSYSTIDLYILTTLKAKLKARQKSLEWKEVKEDE